MLHEGCHVSRGLSLHFDAVTSITSFTSEKKEEKVLDTWHNVNICAALGWKSGCISDFRSFSPLNSIKCGYYNGLNR